MCHNSDLNDFSTALMRVNSTSPRDSAHADLLLITTDLWEISVLFTGGWCNNFTHDYIAILIGVISWRGDSVMDCHAMAQGSIPGENGVLTELHILHKGE